MRLNARKPAKLSKKLIWIFFFHFLGHKSVYFQMVYAEKILVDHIRLFERSENEVKLDFSGSGAKNTKKISLCFTIILECVTKI